MPAAPVWEWPLLPLQPGHPQRARFSLLNPAGGWCLLPTEGDNRVESIPPLRMKSSSSRGTTFEFAPLNKPSHLKEASSGVCVCAHIYACLHLVCMYVHIYASLCLVCVCMCTYMHVYTFFHTAGHMKNIFIPLGAETMRPWP